MTDTAMRRQLTVELKRLRKEAGLTQREVADKQRWSPSKVIRIEQGGVGISVTDLRTLLALYGVTDAGRVTELEDMALGAKQSSPFADFRDVMSPETMRFLGYEGDASLLRQVELNVVPGLLQTEAYTRAMFRSYDIDPRIADRLVESRALRQDALVRENPVQAFFVVDEGALRREIGGADVMRAQVEHMVQMIQRPNVSIFVLPFSVGAHPALTGSFVHLEFPADEDPDVLFFEGPLGYSFVRDDPDLAATYRLRFWDLEDLAVPPESFAEFVSS